jgi:hypothetical protein
MEESHLGQLKPELVEIKSPGLTPSTYFQTGEAPVVFTADL